MKFIKTLPVGENPANTRELCQALFRLPKILFVQGHNFCGEAYHANLVTGKVKYSSHHQPSSFTPSITPSILSSSTHHHHHHHHHLLPCGSVANSFP
ncbi:hypothetical protein E2C01_082159 [Portunus trituberculatus]|uniref:Uncharacterized protein n=1 Tax=Portunus trituberculatus TaxID=210409 RepID=A0A5B7IP78_PORTR|nr:hypothetical protein [Portunus trituberculatus]